MTLKQEAEAIVDRLTPGMVDREPETIVMWIERALAAEREMGAKTAEQGHERGLSGVGIAKAIRAGG